MIAFCCIVPRDLCRYVQKRPDESDQTLLHFGREWPLVWSWILLDPITQMHLALQVHFIESLTTLFNDQLVVHAQYL